MIDILVVLHKMEIGEDNNLSLLNFLKMQNMLFSQQHNIYLIIEVIINYLKEWGLGYELINCIFTHTVLSHLVVIALSDIRTSNIIVNQKHDHVIFMKRVFFSIENWMFSLFHLFSSNPSCCFYDLTFSHKIPYHFDVEDAGVIGCIGFSYMLSLKKRFLEAVQQEYDFQRQVLIGPPL
ncbi:hypothetical protein ACJX0J_019204 [Zea mays]